MWVLVLLITIVLSRCPDLFNNTDDTIETTEEVTVPTDDETSGVPISGRLPDDSVPTT